MTTERYPHGTFCWVDVAVTDAEAAKEFYGSLFGWEPADQNIEGGITYTMLRREGGDVGGLYALSEEMKSRGVPPHWMSYIAVDDVDDVARRATELGGAVMMEPFDIPDIGRMAVISDPTGAVFSLWRAAAGDGGSRPPEGAPGTVCWNELATRDTAAAGDFYTRLLGWTRKDSPMGDMTYTEFKNGDRPAGGMLQMTEEWGAAPPHWLVYFNVSDCDGITEKAVSLGAQVRWAPTDIAGVGRFSVIQDPQGAVFGIIRIEKAC